jgi:hypothetical protein
MKNNTQHNNAPHNDAEHYAIQNNHTQHDNNAQPWTNFSLQDEPWAEFSTLEVAAACIPCTYSPVLQYNLT